MDLPAGPSGVDRSRSPIKKSMKTHILSDAELLDILENDKWISSEEEFDVESEYNYSSDSDDGENEGNDLQNIVMSDYVGSGGNEVGEDFSEMYSSTNFDWSADSQNVNHFEYTATPGLKCLPNGDQPIDYFNLLVTDELLDFLVDETNIYAIEIFLNSVSDKSRISNWVNTNRLEMKTFLSLLFHMGTIKLPRLEDYWKTNKLFNLPFFRTYMSRNRFTILLRALHFSRNPAEGESVPRNRLHKIQPIVNYFNSRMNEIFEPNKNLSLDESMVLWRGRLIFRQYIKNKKHKFGVKMYMLTESWGLIHKIMIYSGQGNDISESMTHTEFVVDNLMSGLYHKGRSLYMDNFYNSVQLSRKLLQKKTYVTGTLRSNRKHNPREVIAQKLKKGESICRYTEDNICVMKWKDKRDVLTISSEFPHSMIEIEKNRSIIKPISVIKYNEHMSGIDRQDQMTSYYPFERKTIRWYKKIGIHCIHLLLVNSYFLYNKYAKKTTLYEFRLSVIEALLPNDLDNNNTRITKKINETHLPKKVEKNDKKKYKYKRCQICSGKGIRKDTIYYCMECNEKPGLCLESCFEEYHKKI